jgi:hypothetical protein
MPSRPPEEQASDVIIQPPSLLSVRPARRSPGGTAPDRTRHRCPVRIVVVRSLVDGPVHDVRIAVAG